MRVILQLVGIIVLFAFLTILTQVGGISYILALITFPFINRKASNRISRFTLKLFSFIVLYSVISFLITPILAARYHRVPLPMFEANNIKPRNIFTCVLNRHYVRPELLKVVKNAALEMNNAYPGTVVNYLDAGFPLFNRYPLMPHLSHNDGKKLDIALFYIDKQSGKPSDLTPSPIGYGVFERPTGNEPDQPFVCQKKGKWQYSISQKLVPQDKKDDFIFDEARTRSMCNYITSDGAIEKIFIEPHLKLRLKLSSTKVRYHGCSAVRHDDHIHIQIH